MSTPKLIRKMLVANRGEIACRIIRTCHAMGIAAVAVFSDADAEALHVRVADEAVRIGPPDASASYLDIAALLEAARRTRAGAVHPGYGFLAEHAGFAQACRDAGLVFIGPAPEVVARMGSKREARQLMAAVGVPVVPGYDGEDQSDRRFVAAAHEVGYPVMVKASAGGGGKGMRVVERAADLPDALAAARREALAAFGDGTLLLEKLIAEPRHVEFQIFGDEHGHLIHLGERECSIQRRHQKVIEETPSTALTPNLRARMAEAALTVGRQLGYTNAGTVEFILDPDGSFYFLEVNTRLQVEHPVTELVTGLDLVRWQILVAEGRPLPLLQEEMAFRGHAVEARVYAEDPASGFLPATGRVALWRAPVGEGVRVDGGIQTGDIVSPHYDPLLAKISAHGTDREEALRRLEHALAETTLLGVRNNLAFLRRMVLHPAHVAGAISTGFIERYAQDLLSAPAGATSFAESLEMAALAVAVSRLGAGASQRAWRNNPSRPIVDRFFPLDAAHGHSEGSERAIEVRLTPQANEEQIAVLGVGERAQTLRVAVFEHVGPDLALEVDGHRLRVTVVEAEPGEWWVNVGGATHALWWRSPLPDPAAMARREGSLAAPMPGQITAVMVEEGQVVRAGDPLLILLAMKMEHVIAAPFDGTVTELRFRQGDAVPAAAILLDLQALEADQEP
jgi:acetyl-CoA carboxylase biotin carboxylase subunit